MIRICLYLFLYSYIVKNLANIYYILMNVVIIHNFYKFQLFAVWLARRYRNQPDPNYKEPHAIFPRSNYLY